jgi:undecaprenyl-diphosphatase
MSFDIPVFQFVNGFVGRSVFLDLLGVFSARFFPYLLVLLFGLLLWKVHYWKDRLYYLSVAVLSLILASGIIVPAFKTLNFRARPFEALNFAPLINGVSHSSFPSAHATFFFTLATAVFFVNKRVGMWFYIGAGIIGVARIFVGVHWLTDIITGALIGIMSVILVRRIVRKPITSYNHSY